MERFTRKPLQFAVIGAVGAVLVLGVLAYATGLLGSRNTEARSNTPVSSYSVNSDPTPLPKVAENSSDAKQDQSAANSSKSDALSNTPSSQAVVPGVPAETNTDHCVSDMAQAQQNYNRDVQKEKKTLDNILSFQVGLNISSQYVSDYNDKVTNIFNEYLDSATKESCTWPVQQPALLPSNYSL